MIKRNFELSREMVNSSLHIHAIKTDKLCPLCIQCPKSLDSGTLFCGHKIGGISCIKKRFPRMTKKQFEEVAQMAKKTTKELKAATKAAQKAAPAAAPVPAEQKQNIALAKAAQTIAQQQAAETAGLKDQLAQMQAVMAQMMQAQQQQAQPIAAPIVPQMQAPAPVQAPAFAQVGQIQTQSIPEPEGEDEIEEDEDVPTQKTGAMSLGELKHKDWIHIPDWVLQGVLGDNWEQYPMSAFKKAVIDKFGITKPAAKPRGRPKVEKQPETQTQQMASPYVPGNVYIVNGQNMLFGSDGRFYPMG